MKCENMYSELVALLYGELEPEEAKRIRAHLKTCRSCKEAYEELQGTSKLLEKWEDVSPRMNFVFVKDATSRWKAFKEKISQLNWGRRLAFGVPAVIVLSFLILSATNFRAGYSEGKWNLSFSLIPQKEKPVQQEKIVGALSQMQSETLQLVKQMIEESEYRQRRESALALTEFARSIEEQRRQDLTMIGRGMDGLHRTTEGKFDQTSNALNELFRLTSYQLEKK
jgi:hypothetical protein